MQMGDNTYTVRILGEKGAGKTCLLALLGSLAERGGAGGAMLGGCLMRIGGAELRLLETEYSDFYGGGDRPTADMWYLTVGLDEGPMNLDIQLRGLGIPRFEAVFLNKVPGEDRADEVIAHGAVIAVIRFDVESGGYALDLRQAGAELFAPCAESNVVSFSGMSGHLKGKSLPGSCVRDVSGSFPAGAPVILRKGGKIGAGTALVSSDSLRDAEKAAIIRSLQRWEGNRTHAAEELGISRRTLISKIHEYGIDL